MLGRVERVKRLQLNRSAAEKNMYPRYFRAFDGFQSENRGKFTIGENCPVKNVREEPKNKAKRSFCYLKTLKNKPAYEMYRRTKKLISEPSKSVSGQ